MNLLQSQLGLNLKKYNWFIVSFLITGLYLLLTGFYPLSVGDRYQNNLSRYYYLLETNQFQKADQIQPKIDEQDILYTAGLSHPKYITSVIVNILKKPNRKTDDLIEVALLYLKMGDKQNARNFLLLARQSDPIRSDIEKLIQTLF